jgi:hypothetical protein
VSFDRWNRGGQEIDRMSDNASTKPKSTPATLAHKIYDQAILDSGGDAYEASIFVMRFLTEALVYSAGMAVGGDEEALKGVLAHLAKMVAEAPVHPIVAAVAARRKMPAATHALWGGRALCDDPLLRGVPRDWPDGQRWISLRDVAEGAAEPPDRCVACWALVPALVEELRQIGSDR